MNYSPNSWMDTSAQEFCFSCILPACLGIPMYVLCFKHSWGCNACSENTLESCSTKAIECWCCKCNYFWVITWAILFTLQAYRPLTGLLVYQFINPCVCVDWMMLRSNKSGIYSVWNIERLHKRGINWNDQSGLPWKPVSPCSIAWLISHE